MRFDLLFGILRSRFWLVASIVAITTLMAITGSLLMSKRYSAATTIYVDANTVDQVSGMAAPTRETIRNMLASQTELIQSSQVVNRVIKDLKLAQDEDVQADWQKATKGRGSIDDWLANVLLKSSPSVPSGPVPSVLPRSPTASPTPTRQQPLNCAPSRLRNTPSALPRRSRSTRPRSRLPRTS